MKLCEVVAGIVEGLGAGFTPRQLQVLDLLVRLPPELLRPLAESIRQGWFAGREWSDYLGEVTTGGATYAGSEWTEGYLDSPGASAGWTCHWARDPKRWSKRVDAALSRALRLLRRVERAAAGLPPIHK